MRDVQLRREELKNKKQKKPNKKKNPPSAQPPKNQTARHPHTYPRRGVEHGVQHVVGALVGLQRNNGAVGIGRGYVLAASLFSPERQRMRCWLASGSQPRDTYGSDGARSFVDGAAGLNSGRYHERDIFFY
jgi:hypothetical protein